MQQQFDQGQGLDLSLEKKFNKEADIMEQTLNHSQKMVAKFHKQARMRVYRRFP